MHEYGNIGGGIRAARRSSTRSVRVVYVSFLAGPFVLLHIPAGQDNGLGRLAGGGLGGWFDKSAVGGAAGRTRGYFCNVKAVRMGDRIFKS